MCSVFFMPYDIAILVWHFSICRRAAILCHCGRSGLSVSPDPASPARSLGKLYLLLSCLPITACNRAGRHLSVVDVLVSIE